MTNPIIPPAAPAVPVYPALGSPNFNQEAYTYGSSMPAVSAGIGAIGDATYTNAVAANERAVAADSSAAAAAAQADAAMGYRNTAQSAAATATTKAAEADASAIAASKLNLGAKAAEPTTDNQGAPLRVGATYYDTTLNQWRVWTGSGWGAGLSINLPNEIHSATGKPTPVDSDELGIIDSAAGFSLKKLTFAALKTWFASLFVSKSGDTMTGPLTVEGENYADIMIRAYGNSGDGAVFHGNQALGTKAAPLPPSAGTPIFGIGARPWTGTQWAAHSTAAIHMFARENVSNTAQGTSFRIAVTPLGGTWNDRIHAVAFECDGVGQGARWRAKFSGATQAQRSFVQDASGAPTAFGVLSGGASGSSAAVNCFSRSDPDNSPYVQLSANEAIGVCRVYSGTVGTAPVLPLVLGAGAAVNALTIETSGNVLVTSPAGLGYGVGAGGAVVQSTSKSTAVTLNKPCGQIKMHAANMNANESVTFALYSAAIGTAYNDVVVVTPAANANYEARIVGVEPGLAYIRVTNISGSSRAEALSLNFAVIKTST